MRYVFCITFTGASARPRDTDTLVLAAGRYGGACSGEPDDLRLTQPRGNAESGLFAAWTTPFTPPSSPSPYVSRSEWGHT
jgi:hypothetical protein